MKKQFLYILFFGFMLGGCNPTIPVTPLEPEEEQLDSTRMLGGDISLLTRYENFGAVYKDSLGVIVEPLELFKETGMNSARLRLFVNPDTSSDACQNLSYVTALAKRIKEAGFTFMLDFHYSDTWADPIQQTKPATWNDLPFETLKDTLYTYTKNCLETLIAAGATPDYIQIGNEITSGMLWDDGRVNYNSTSNWNNLALLLGSASTACREVCPNAQLIIHIERSGNRTLVQKFFQNINDFEVDYDIIGLSYYPHWHGTISSLESTLKMLNTNHPEKKIMIVEFGYNNNWYPTDATYDFTSTYPATAKGQAKITADLITMLKSHQQVTGLYWWFPEENEATYTGILQGWTNRGLFDNNTGKALPALYELKNFRKK